MTVRKTHWFWNLLVVITFIVCLSALTLHYKNWLSVKSNQIQIYSGFYSAKISYSKIDSLKLVSRIPPMDRLHGFSALEKEKGVFREFKDSLTDKKVHVFVDNINQNKIKLVYKDSSYVYFNLKDSVETIQLFQKLSANTSALSEPN
ncbi:hypothetical protein DFQ03_0575 [Maribacter caenipelagi]|uniref:PH (Pleckstrin Homology) domain-containing protein n=1 Tax=Maribacter caenipelagi TaxID=1447781 RepID=A0A4R7DEU7_9FLAO|nr:hypothetical protein [Maribacter caenipelagi]TDS18865.1 hypothetical protein DFQ03_0575 [Maribacter caenipelagi]